MPSVVSGQIQELYLAVGNTSLVDAISLTNFAAAFSFQTPAITQLIESLPIQGMKVLRGCTFERTNVSKASTSGGAQQQMTVTLPLAITADTGDHAIAQLQAILTKVREAQRARGAYGLGTAVYLWCRYVGSAQYVYYPVTDATWDPLLPGPGWSTLNLLVGVLTLTCLPYAQGDAITDPVSAVLTATSPTLSRQAIPGDVEALTRLWATDLSANSKVMQGLTLLSRSLDQMGPADFTPTHAVSATGAGTTYTDSTALGGSTARLAPVTATPQTVGLFSPTSGAFQSGEYDVLLRVRDSTPVIGSAGTLAINTTTSGTTELLFGGSGITTSSSTAPSNAAGSGWTALTTLTATGAGALGLAAMYQAVSTAGSYSANGTWTTGAGAVGLGAAVVSYKGLPGQIAFVKTIGTTANYGSASSLSVTVPSAGVAKGHTVILALQWNRYPSGITFAGSDGRGNVYSVDAVAYDGTQYYVQLSAPVTTALQSGDTITVKASNGTQYGGALGAYEFAGLDTSAARVDQTSTATGSSTGAWSSGAITINAGQLPAGTYDYAYVPQSGTTPGPVSRATLLLPGPFGGTEVLFSDDFENELVPGTTQWDAYTNHVGFVSAAAYAGALGASIASSGFMARPTPPEPATKQLYLQFDIQPQLSSTSTSTAVQLGDFNLTFSYVSSTTVQVGASIGSLTLDYDTIANNAWSELGILWDGNGPTGRFLYVHGNTSTWNWVDDTQGTATYPNLIQFTAGTGALYVDNVVVLSSNPQMATPPSLGASNVLSWSAAQNANAGALYFRWTPPSGQIQPWYQIPVGNVTSFTHATLFPNGTVLATPPSGAPPILATQVRLATGTAAGELVPGPAVACRVGSGEWEWLPLGTYPLPPSEVPEGMAAFPWVAEIQADNLSTDSSTKTLDVDMAVLVPRDGDSLTVLAPTPLATPGLWMIDTRRDNRVSASIYATSTVTASGSVVTDATRAANSLNDGATVPGGWGIYDVGTTMQAGSISTVPRTQAPFGLMGTATTGGFALAYVPADTGTYRWLVSVSNGSENECIECFYAPGEFVLNREHGGTFSSVTASYSTTPGTPVTVVGSWTATQISLSVNGGAFVTAANTLIPSGLGTNADIGTKLNYSASDNYNTLGGRLLWFAGLTGTPTSADLTMLAALPAATAPTLDLWSTAAAVSAIWPCRQATYGTSILLGAASVTGQCLLGPANALLGVIPLYQDAAGNLIADVPDWALSVQLSLRPRFGFLRGAV
jgi:hypothetical protein